MNGVTERGLDAVFEVNLHQENMIHYKEKPVGRLLVTIPLLKFESHQDSSSALAVDIVKTSILTNTMSVNIQFGTGDDTSGKVVLARRPRMS